MSAAARTGSSSVLSLRRRRPKIRKRDISAFRRKLLLSVNSQKKSLFRFSELPDFEHEEVKEDL